MMPKGDYVCRLSTLDIRSPVRRKRPVGKRETRLEFRRSARVPACDWDDPDEVGFLQPPALNRNASERV
jgi:hypothetical protein